MIIYFKTTNNPLKGVRKMSNPKMRFPKQALEELKRIDPETPIKVGYIRKLVHTGVIPSVAIGKRRLLNLDSLLDYLANPPAETPEPVRPGIRRIDERC